MLPFASPISKVLVLLLLELLIRQLLDFITIVEMDLLIFTKDTLDQAYFGRAGLCRLITSLVQDLDDSTAFAGLPAMCDLSVLLFRASCSHHWQPVWSCIWFLVHLYLSFVTSMASGGFVLLLVLIPGLLRFGCQSGHHSDEVLVARDVGKPQFWR